MIETAKVLNLRDDGSAEVVIQRNAECGDCKICASLNPDKPYSLVADNPIGAEPGELVRLEIEPRRFISAGAVLFILPLVGFALGFLLVSFLVDISTDSGTGLAAGGGILCLAGFFWLAARLGKRKRRRPLVRLIDRLGPVDTVDAPDCPPTS